MAFPRGLNIRGENLIISDEKNGVIIYNVVTGAKFVFKEWNDRNFVKEVSAMCAQDGFFYVLDSVPDKIYCFSPPRHSILILKWMSYSIDSNNFRCCMM
jgi:hypothetical protein